MAAVDLDKLETAIKYVQRIAEGCNPVNNVPAGLPDCGLQRRGGKRDHDAYSKGKGAWHLYGGPKYAGKHLSGCDL